MAELLVVGRRIEQLLEILTKQSLRQVFAEELSDPQSEALYWATGTKTISAIAEEIGWSPATISRTWTRWNRLGLLVKDGRSYRRSFEDNGGAGAGEKAAGQPRARKRSGREINDGDNQSEA